MQAFLSLFSSQEADTSPATSDALPFKETNEAVVEEEEEEAGAETASTPQELLRSSGKNVLVVPTRRVSYTPPWKSMSFSCGGWLQFYLFGVARALQAAGLDKGVTYCGCSAGALAAAGLALDGDFDRAIEYCKDECIPMAHGHVFGLFMLADYVSKCIDMLVVPKFDPNMLGQDNLQIAISRMPYGPFLPILASERVTRHPSPEDLKHTLLSSCAAWPAAPLTNHPRFGLCVDGGLSDFQPIVDAETITVSPFYFSDCDIKPSRYVPPWWAMVPPKSRDTIDWTYNLGWDDAMAFIAKKGLPMSPHVRPHLSDKKIRQENNHPFDTPRKISMHRFLGYDLFDITHQYVSFTMDLLLLLFLLLVWRPVALVAIYFELFFRLVFSIAMSFVYEVYLAHTRTRTHHTPLSLSHTHTHTITLIVA